MTIGARAAFSLASCWAGVGSLPGGRFGRNTARVSNVASWRIADDALLADWWYSLLFLSVGLFTGDLLLQSTAGGSANGLHVSRPSVEKRVRGRWVRGRMRLQKKKLVVLVGDVIRWVQFVRGRGAVSRCPDEQIDAREPSARLVFNGKKRCRVPIWLTRAL